MAAHIFLFSAPLIHTQHTTQSKRDLLSERTTNYFINWRFKDNDIYMKKKVIPRCLLDVFASVRFVLFMSHSLVFFCRTFKSLLCYYMNTLF